MGLIKERNGIKLTFTPGVKQQEEIVFRPALENDIPFRGHYYHAELVAANKGSWWRDDAQFDPVAVLLDNLGLPFFAMKLLN